LSLIDSSVSRSIAIVGRNFRITCYKQDRRPYNIKRRKMKKYTFLLILTVIISSCKTEERATPTVELADYSGDYVLQLNELMTDISVVKLSTSDSTLVPEGYDIHMGKRYILILSNGSVLQFDKNGNFIRKLAKKGNGPGEISYIASFDVNDEESRLFIHSANKRGFLLVYDLHTGEVLPRIKLPDNRLVGFIYAGDHILWWGGLNWNEPPQDFRELYTMSFDGEPIAINTKTDLKENKLLGRPTYSWRVNGIVYYLDNLCDTIFTIDGVIKSAFCFLKYDDIYHMDTNPKGKTVWLDILSENKFKLMVKYGGKEFLWNPKVNTLKNLTGYYHDFFKMEVEDLEFESREDVGFIKYQAIDFKYMLAKSLENRDLGSKKRKQLEELDEEISEEDNPIILVGRVKDR